MTKDSHPRLARAAEFRFYEELNDVLPVGGERVALNSDASNAAAAP